MKGFVVTGGASGIGAVIARAADAAPDRDHVQRRRHLDADV